MTANGQRGMDGVRVREAAVTGGGDRSNRRDGARGDT